MTNLSLLIALVATIFAGAVTAIVLAIGRPLAVFAVSAIRS